VQVGPYATLEDNVQVRNGIMISSYAIIEMVQLSGMAALLKFCHTQR
jgi:acyl-[acyl carrier protein]--UDP-N-acetylglucosamine O-acyltransferase